MSGPMTQAARIIGKFGGEEVVAEVLGITIPRIRRWSFTGEKGGNDGRVPPKHYEALLRAASERGVKLSPADFFEATTQ